MITKISYKNFKALRDTSLPLGHFTLIVGANGSGKTTAMKALEIAKNPKRFAWKDVVSVNLLTEKSESVVIEIQTMGSSRKIIWEVDEKAREEANDEEDFNGIIRKRFQEAITESFIGFKIFNFDSDKIAEPVAISPNIELSENGRGLAGVLDQLRDSNPEKFEELNQELNKWFYEYDRILFDVPDDGKKTFLLRTTFGKHKINAKDLSHGTLLALAFLTIAYLPNPPKIVCFEEPERGVHPRLLREIQEAMYRLAYPENFGEKRAPTQVIATTHSPYFLDLYKEHPEEIVIASKDENGVRFEKLSDKPHIEEILQDAPLGEVWYSGILGGVPAQI